MGHRVDSHRQAVLVCDVHDEKVAEDEFDDPLQNEGQSDGRCRRIDVLIATSWGENVPQVVPKPQIVRIGGRQRE